MPLCRDPSLTFLNREGYSVVRLPRRGIAPLDVLGRDGGNLERLGRLEQIWTSESAVPVSGRPQPAADISGHASRGIKLSLGLKILGDILGGLGAAVPQLGAAYSNARKIQFFFRNVESVGVDPFEIGDFLAEGDLDMGNPFVEHYFEDPNNEAYVLSEVLQSSSLAVVALGRGDTSVDVDVPALQNAVGGDVGVSLDSSNQSVVVFEGQYPITFGFKAFGIAFADGEWQVEGISAAGDTSFLGTAGETAPEAVVFGDGSLIDLGEADSG